MGRLQHNDITQAQRSNPNRPFHTLGVTPFVSTVMLGTALTFGGAALGGGAAISCLLTSRVAMAQDKEVGGRNFTIFKLEKPLVELERDTGRIAAVHEFQLGTPGVKQYLHSVQLPNGLGFVVGLDHNDVHRQGHRMTVEVSIPNVRDKGYIFDLKEFAGYVRETFGKDMMRVKAILQTGMITLNGVKVGYVTEYLFPLDSEGKMITRLENGQYVVYGVTYYNGNAGASIALIEEPNNVSTLARN